MFTRALLPKVPKFIVPYANIRRLSLASNLWGRRSRTAESNAAGFPPVSAETLDGGLQIQPYRSLKKIARRTLCAIVEATSSAAVPSLVAASPSRSRPVLPRVDEFEPLASR